MMRRAPASAVLLAVLVAALVLVPGPALAADGLSVPSKLGPPTPWTTHLDRAPVDTASVIFSGPEWWQDGQRGMVAVVGGARDDYRLYSDESGSYAGHDALLSPDGGRMARVGGIVDLRTGRVQALPALEGDYATPQAWSPDGARLAVIAYTQAPPSSPDTEQSEQPIQALLYVVELATNTATRIAELEPFTTEDGWNAAFSPDGRRLAFQLGRSIVVADLDGRVLSRFDAALGSRLAGKGAWTRDGNGLVLASQEHCCTGDRYPSSWRLTPVDPATGGPVTGQSPYTIRGVLAVRLLGWWPDGAPVVVAYYPDGSSPVVDFAPGTDTSGLADLEWVDHAKALILTAGSGQRTLVDANGSTALTLDIADGAIAAGKTRAGQPPWPTYGEVVIGVALLALLLLGGGVTAVTLVYRRRRRREPAATQ